MENNWPLLYSQVLKVGNLDSPVGIATMWTEREVVKNFLPDNNYCVIGNLYSSAGISSIIRNIYARPTINKIVLWGADLSRSGQALLAFMQNGVGENWEIIGDEKGGFIEKDIDKESIDKFRKSIEVVNLRGKPVSELKETVKKLSQEKAQPFDKPKIFSSSKPKPFTYPSEQIGVRVAGKTTAQTWLKVLNNIMRYGRVKSTRYTKENELKELLNIIAVVYEEDPDNIYFPHYLPFTKKDLEVYYPQVLSVKQIPGIAYTYGQRLRNHDGVDQIAEIVKLIKTRPFSKKMIAVTANVKEDWGVVNHGDTPCLTNVLCSIQDSKLFMTTHFRSQDMVHGWPRNVFSLRKLQKIIADEAGYEMGAFCMITHSAHIYSDDYELVEKILAENYEKELGFTRQQHFEEDKRGNCIVEVEYKTSDKKRGRGRPPKDSRSSKYTSINSGNLGSGIRDGEIVARLYAPNGGPLLKEWRGKTAMEIYINMSDWDYFTMPSHLIYIGTELQRAEYALRQGAVYSQDPAPNKGL